MITFELNDIVEYETLIDALQDAINHNRMKQLQSARDNNSEYLAMYADKVKSYERLLKYMELSRHETNKTK